MRRRGSRMTGKNDPLRSLGIRSSTSPAWVASNRSRAPLRSVTRDSDRSYLGAPIRSVASASISSCITIRTDSRTRSTPSPARNASSSSDRADWDKAIGGSPSVRAYGFHTEAPADGRLLHDASPDLKPPPRHGTLLTRVRLRPAHREGDGPGTFRGMGVTPCSGNLIDQAPGVAAALGPDPHRVAVLI